MFVCERLDIGSGLGAHFFGEHPCRTGEGQGYRSFLPLLFQERASKENLRGPQLAPTGFESGDLFPTSDPLA